MPAMVENSWSTSSMRTAVIAAPGSELSSTRRSALPSVVPKPAGSGWTTKREGRPSSLSWISICGVTSWVNDVPPRAARPVSDTSAANPRASGWLARVVFDNNAFIEGAIGVGPGRDAGHTADHLLAVEREPAGRRRGLRRRLAHLEVLGRAAARRPADHVADLHLRRRDICLAPVEGDMAVAHDLAALIARVGPAEPVHDVIEPL